MNSKSMLFALSGLLILSASCKKELEPQESSAPADSSAVAAQATMPTPAAPTQSPPATVQPVQQSAQPAQVAKGMNPAHGQPGHRCDIPVGASLSSPPTKPAAPAATPTQNATRIVPQQPKAASGAPAILSAPGAAQTTAPGMNPPHGQEGHRCEVAVGAPLPKS